MQDKSSRADSDLADGNRNGCFLGHPSLLDLGLGLGALPFPQKREREIKTGSNPRRQCSPYGWDIVEWAKETTPDSSEKFSKVELGRSEKFVRRDILYDGNMV